MSHEDKLAKFFPDLSEEKVAALDDAQITKVINLECARRGIPLFLEEMAKPVLEQKPDSELYNIGIWNFGKSEHAEQVRALIASLPRFKIPYDYKVYGEGKTFEPDDSEPDWTKKLVFSQAAHHKFKAELDTHEMRLREYETHKKKVEQATGEKELVISDVWSIVHNCREKINQRARIIDLYKKYVELAEGDRQIAWNFLRRAERLTTEDIATMKLHEANELGDLTMEELTPEEQVIL